MGATLFEKVWQAHTVRRLPNGQQQLFIGLHLIHEVTTPQAFDMLRARGLRVAMPDRTIGTVVYAKDVILDIIRRLGVKGGAGFAYEYAGDTIGGLSMDERMTICNMSIEGGARVGYVNPDQTTFDYLRGRTFAPQGDDFD